MGLKVWTLPSLLYLIKAAHYKFVTGFSSRQTISFPNMRCRSPPGREWLERVNIRFCNIWVR